MFQHAQEYQRVYKALVEEKGGHTMFSYIQKYLTTLILGHLKPQFPSKKKEQIPLEILTLYLVSTLTALLTWWLDHDMPYPTERINVMFRQLAQPSVDAIMQNN